MEITTERLVLREFAKEDSQSLYKLFTEKFVATYEAHLQMKDITDVENYIKFHLENRKSLDKTHFFFIIETKETREFLGIVGYSFVEKTEIRGVVGSIMELEYYLLEEYWGKGFMTESLRKVVALAFEQGNIVKLFAQCHIENVASENVMIKCGMRKSEKQPNPKNYNGVLKENVRYELTADNYVR